MAANRGRGGGSVIDPPPGGVFRDPVEMGNLSGSPGIVEVEVEAKIAPVNVQGTAVDVLTYNGSFPAPTIRVRKGDLLKVRFRNSLPPTSQRNDLGFTRNVTNLHTHGWHVSPSGNADNIFLHFKPDEEFEFVYNTSLQEAGTLSWYHPHVHGLVAEQLWAGLAGVLVVEDEMPILSDYETHIVILKDIDLNGSQIASLTRADYQWGKEGHTIMVNGQVNPVLHIRPGQVQRWRVLNASTSRYYKLSLESHTMYLVGTDGNLLDRPYPLTEILVTPGERIDVLVPADRTPGSYRLRSLPYNRGRNTSETVTLLTVSCEGSGKEDIIPRIINPSARVPDVDLGSLPQRNMTLQMMMGRGLINRHDFDRNPYVIHSDVGTYEIWRISNMSMMDHPFHQHTNAGWILGINGGDPGYASLYTSIPGWKDTVNVPRMGSVDILVPIRDFTGSAVYHCHIVEHEDIGMMGMWAARLGMVFHLPGLLGPGVYSDLLLVEIVHLSVAYPTRFLLAPS